MAVQKKLETEVRAAYAYISEKETQIRKLAQNQAELPKAEQTLRLPQIRRVEKTQPVQKTPELPARKPQKSTEHLGMTTLKALEARPENTRPQSAETMSRQELLEASDHIAVGATTVRKVYETNLISERGLRRVVGEYRRGGDVRRVLAEEMLSKELSYERDPLLRDRQLNVEGQGISGGRQAVQHTESSANTQGEPPTAETPSRSG